MEIKKNYLEDLKKKSEENKYKRTIPAWQEYAFSVCKEFNIARVTVLKNDKNGKERYVTQNWPAVIYRHACNNLAYLKGKVELAREMFNGDVQGKGKYLLALFRKNPPWKK